MSLPNCSQVHFQSLHRSLSRSYLSRDPRAGGEQGSAFGREVVGRANAGRAVPTAAQRLDQDRKGRGSQALVRGLLLLPFPGPCNVGDRPKWGYNYFLNIRFI